MQGIKNVLGKIGDQVRDYVKTVAAKHTIKNTLGLTDEEAEGAYNAWLIECNDVDQAVSFTEKWVAKSRIDQAAYLKRLEDAAATEVEEEAKQAGERSVINAESKRDTDRIQAEKEKGLAYLKAFFSRENMTRITMASAGVIGSYFAFKLIHTQLQKWLSKPTLVREESRESLLTRLNPFKKKNPLDILKLDELVYSPEIRQSLDDYLYATLNARKDGMPYPNLLLFGLPGTGKTSFATSFALELKNSLSKQGINVEYVRTSGVAIDQFKEGEDIREIFKLLDYLNSLKNDTILIVEEADSVFRSRLSHATSEKSKKITNTLLELTGTESKKIGIIYLTNLSAVLDKAILSRCDIKIEIKLPDLNARKQIVKQFIEKYILAKFKIINITHDDIDFIAKETEGFSGRSLSQLVRSLHAVISRNKESKEMRPLIKEALEKFKMAEQTSLLATLY